MMFKFQRGGYVTQPDNTRVNIPPIITFKSKQKKVYKQKKSVIQDADKVKRYRNMQNFYNNNVFGNGVFGKQTRLDPSKEEDQRKIESNMNYAKDNVVNVSQNLLLSGIGGYIRGMYPMLSKGNIPGNISTYNPYKIGEGAEAIVIRNSPGTVGKITQISLQEAAKRNTVPNTLPLKFIGYVKDGVNKFPTYLQDRVRIVTEKSFPKYIKKLDKTMSKNGYKVINDPYVQYRAYTNGSVVIDDVAPNNIGIDVFGKPKLIDFSIQPVQEWVDIGYSLKNGGKLIY